MNRRIFCMVLSLLLPVCMAFAAEDADIPDEAAGQELLEVNIAQEKSVLTNTSPYSTSMGVENLTDGNLSSLATANQSTTDRYGFVIDLGARYTVTKIEIYARKGSTSDLSYAHCYSGSVKYDTTEDLIQNYISSTPGVEEWSTTGVYQDGKDTESYVNDGIITYTGERDARYIVLSKKASSGLIAAYEVKVFGTRFIGVGTFPKSGAENVSNNTLENKYMKLMFDEEVAKETLMNANIQIVSDGGDTVEFTDDSCIFDGKNFGIDMRILESDTKYTVSISPNVLYMNGESVVPNDYSFTFITGRIYKTEPEPTEVNVALGKKVYVNESVGPYASSYKSESITDGDGNTNYAYAQSNGSTVYFKVDLGDIYDLSSISVTTRKSSSNSDTAYAEIRVSEDDVSVDNMQLIYAAPSSGFPRDISSNVETRYEVEEGTRVRYVAVSRKTSGIFVLAEIKAFAKIYDVAEEIAASTTELIDSGKYSFGVSVRNNRNLDSARYLLVAAAYTENGEMIDVSCEEKEIKPGDSEGLSVELSANERIDSVKAVVLNKNGVPLGAAFEIK